MVTFGFDFKKAARLSLCLVLGNLISQFFLNRKSCHPKDSTRPLQYWDLVFVFAPAQLMGSTLGIVFRDNIPSTAAECVAAAVLTFAATKSVYKGIHTHRIESRASNLTISTNDASIDSGAIMFSTDSKGQPLLAKDEFRSEEPSASESYESRRVEQPWRPISYLFLAWTVYTACFSAMAFVNACSPAYVSLLVAVYIPLGAFVSWAVNYVSRY